MPWAAFFRPHPADLIIAVNPEAAPPTTAEAELVGSWLAEALPVRATGMVIELGSGPYVVDPARGGVGAPLMLALLDRAIREVGEVIPEEAAVMYREGLQLPDRTRAFLAGWAAARARALDDYVDRRGDPASALDVREYLASPVWLLEDLELESREQCAEAVARAVWNDSAPELPALPDLADRAATEPVASDRARERALEVDPSAAASLEYGAWLAAREDQRGTLFRLQSGESKEFDSVAAPS